jgi:RNA polymerase sigma-70 factor (ECF subfamily)
MSAPASTVQPPLNEDTDSRLLERLGRGDMAALEEIRARYGRRIWAYAFRITKLPDRADDVAQETLLNLYRGAWLYRKLESQFGLIPLLLRIATNVAANLRKRDSRSEELQASYAATLSRVAEATDHPLLAAEAAAQLTAALAKLPGKYRVPFLLYEIHAWRYEEIAQVCRINIGTVKSRIARGRHLLRALLHRYWKG